MRKTKKLVSLLLTLVMAFAMTMTAFAEENSSVEHSYEIYQIFTGDCSQNTDSKAVLSNVKWGKNGTGTEGEAVSDEILKELADVAGSASDTAKLAVITKYVNLNSNPITEGKVTSYTELDNGYYLVKDKDGSLNGKDEAYTLYVTKVVDGTLEFVPKGDVPETEKKIVEGNDRADVNEASIGDTVQYEITATLPDNLDDYKTYYYVFTDTLSKGLTYGKDVKVTVDGKDLTTYFYVNATEYNETTGTTITVGIQDLKALNNLEGIALTKDSKIVITYSAVLNENAVIAGEGNTNDVKLTYFNDPNQSGEGSTTPPPENPDKPEPTHPTGETPEDEVTTYTTELTILKKDEEGNVLPGAEFTLSGESVNVVLVTAESFVEDEDGEYWKLKDGTYTTIAPTTTGGEDDNSDDYDSTDTKYKKTVTVTAKGTGKAETTVKGVIDAGGHVTFTGLGAGKYTITETVTPEGYNTIAPVSFTISFDSAAKKFISDNEDIVVGNDNRLDTKIINKKGVELPTTGGTGTTLIYLIGSILVVVAAVLLVTRRRMRVEK